MVRALAFLACESLVADRVDLSDFLLYWGERNGDGDRTRSVVHQARRETFRGSDTAAVLRMLYGLLQGADRAVVDVIASEWFARRSADGVASGTPVLRPAALAVVDHHRSTGDRVVLVSTSLRMCLDPVVAAVGADAGLAAEPVVVDGRVSAETPEPLVGAARLAAVTAFADRCGVPLGRCHAYGASAVDRPMLAAVGHPHVVGAHPVLVAAARDAAWPVLRWDPPRSLTVVPL